MPDEPDDQAPSPEEAHASAQGLNAAREGARRGPRLGDLLQWTLARHVRIGLEEGARMWEATHAGDAHRAAEAAVAMSRHIAGAKALTGTAWRSKLAQFGLEPETVWHSLQIDRLGLEVEDVIALGGPGAVLDTARIIQLPKEGEALSFIRGEWTEKDPAPVCYVWRVPGAFCAGLMDLWNHRDHGEVTPQPLKEERELWRAVWRILGRRFDGVRVVPMMPEDEAQVALIASLERERLAILRRNIPAVH